MKIHYRNKFVDWMDGRLTSGQKKQIDDHLKSCHSCKKYFLAMINLMTKPEETVLPELTPLPFEKTKIETLARTKREGKSGTAWLPAKLKTAYAFLLVLGLAAGIWIGKGNEQSLQNTDLYKVATEEQQFISESQMAFTDVWESMTEEYYNEN